jgi:hypothetical protein
MLAYAKQQHIVIESAFIYRIIKKVVKLSNLKVVKSAFIHKIVNLFLKMYIASHFSLYIAYILPHILLVFSHILFLYSLYIVFLLSHI